MPFCELCNREMERLTKHHLTPKSRGGAKEPVALICVQCAAQIHELFDNKILEKELNTIEKMKENSDIQKYVKWVQKQKYDRFKTKRSSSRR